MKEKIKELIECCINDSEYVCKKHYARYVNYTPINTQPGISITNCENLHKTFNYLDSDEYLRSERILQFNIYFVFDNEPELRIYPIIKDREVSIIDELHNVPKRWYHLSLRKENVKIKCETNIYEYEIACGNFKFRVDEDYAINLRDTIYKNYDKFINLENEKIISDRIQEFKNK